MKKLLVLLASLALSACAGAPVTQPYADYVTGESLRELRYHQLHSWHRSTDKSVILYTRPSVAYLLDLAHTCSELRDPRAMIAIGRMASDRGSLRVGDDLMVGQMKCPVSDIRLIDLARMKADRQAYAPAKR